MNDIRFSILNIRFRISFWFVAIITLYALIFENALRVLLAIILHEAAHILMLYLSGAAVTEMSLRITDINMKADTDVIGKAEKIAVALAGPAANLLACFTSYLWDDEIFFGVNLAVALFQLLPCKGSDGGEVIEMLMGQYGSFCIKLLSIFSVFTVAVISALMLIQGEGNISLAIAGLYIVFMACK